MRQLLYKCLIITFCFAGFSQTIFANISNINKNTTNAQLQKMRLIDASSLLRCEKDSVKQASCIPANTFQSPKGVLASFYNITWVFGTAGIQGTEELLVFADTEKQRDALLGILYLAGHKTLWRWNAKKSDLQNILGMGKGQKRGIIRSKYYIANMRDKYLVLADEVASLKKQGWKLSSKDILKAKKTIIYGSKPLDAIANFTRVFMQKTDTQSLKLMIHSP